MASQLEELTREECIARLKRCTVGRISIVEGGFPLVFPVNYRVVETQSGPWIVLRTRPHSVIDHLGTNVCLEVDSVEPKTREGWSVLFCGRLDGLMVDTPQLEEEFQPDPWIKKKRKTWLVIEPEKISGRWLHPSASRPRAG